VRAVRALQGSVVVDSLPFSQSGTAEHARALRAAGVHALAGYLGAMTPGRLADILAAGLSFIPVTFAGAYANGPADEVGQLHALGIPAGTSVFLDLEGMSAFKADPSALISAINTWADGIAAAGFIPCLYVGVPQPLTSDELWGLRVRGYWRGQGSIRDRKNALAEPTGCGWMMTQVFPSRNVGDPAVWVDLNMVGADYKGRTPSWVVAI
jgi:hypothetical protein